MENDKRLKVEQWLIINQDILNIEGIERRAKITRGTIQKFLRYDRKISDHRIEKLHEILENIILSKSIDIGDLKASGIHNENYLHCG